MATVCAIASADVTGGTVLITGATSGIGQATARLLAPRVDRLLVHGPEPLDAVTSVVTDLRARLSDGASLQYLQADYARLAEVDRLAGEVVEAADRLDLVINNAARPGAPTRTLTTDGNEQTLQVNYLAPVALTSLLLDHVEHQQRARIVNVASATHLSATLDLDDLDLGRGYSPVTAYAQAKLALVAYSCWLADRVPHPGVEVVSVHPGVIATGLLHAMFSIGGESPDSAGRTLATVAGRSGDNGTYYDETRPADPNPLTRDVGFQQRLRDRTARKLAGAGIRSGPASRGR